ncbi:MAG: YaaA family protein [Rikenellaceae bacterium]
MIALISPAKRMCGVETRFGEISTQPRFMEQTRHILSLMGGYSGGELAEIFKVSAPIARELKQHFALSAMDINTATPAVECYDGVVYKHFKGDFTLSEAKYLQRHLRISSLLYGLLRPYDMIKPYRMEGFVRLAGSDERVDNYWRNVQTQSLIDDVRDAGGELLYLASKEEQRAFNWQQVKRQVRVIDIQFLVNRGGKLKQVVIYTKMARGEMVRYMVDGGVTNPQELKLFSWGGYNYREELSSDDKWVWVMES